MAVPSAVASAALAVVVVVAAAALVTVAAEIACFQMGIAWTAKQARRGAAFCHNLDPFQSENSFIIKVIIWFEGRKKTLVCLSAHDRIGRSLRRFG